MSQKTKLEIIQEAMERAGANPFMEGLKIDPVKHTTLYKTDGSVESFTQIDLIRNPGGVWELPK